MIETVTAVTTIVMPEYEDSGPDHWQSRWCRADPGLVRITGLDWDRPEREAWVTALGTPMATTCESRPATEGHPS